MADLKQPLPPASAPATGPGGLPTVGQRMWQQQAHDLLAQLNGILSNNVFDWPVLKENGNEVLTVANIGTGAGKVVAFDGAAKYPAADGSQITGIAQSGRLIAGTPLVLNPYALSSSTSQAHGLGVAPAHISTVWECLSADLNYSVGDKVLGPVGQSVTLVVLFDATNLTLVTDNANTAFVNKTSFAFAAITASRWKITLTPYKLT